MAIKNLLPLSIIKGSNTIIDHKYIQLDSQSYKQKILPQAKTICFRVILEIFKRTVSRTKDHETLAF